MLSENIQQTSCLEYPCVFSRERISGVVPRVPAARSYRFWGLAARSYRFWGPSGALHSKKLSILVIFDQTMSFVTQNALSTFEKVIFHQDFSPKAAATRNGVLVLIPNGQFPRSFIEFVRKTGPDSEKTCCHGPN